MTKQANPDDEIDALKANILFKIDLLKRRGALCGELNTQFANIGFDNSNTFKSLSSKIKNLESGDVKKQLKQAHQVVGKQLNDHIQFNNKRAYFYSLSQKNLDQLFKLLQQPAE